MCSALDVPVPHSTEANIQVHLPARRKRAGVPRRRWEKQELHFLWHSAGTDTVRVIARRLGRTERAVRWRLGILGMSAKIKNSWSQRELQQMLHVGSNRLRQWIKNGALKGRGARIGERALRAFVRQHVDQINWILIDPDLRQWFIEECHLPTATTDKPIVQPISKHALVKYDCPTCRKRIQGNSYFRHLRCCRELMAWLKNKGSSFNNTHQFERGT